MHKKLGCSDSMKTALSTKNTRSAARRCLIPRVLIAFLFFATGIVLAGGGTWKMGPFGPYWDDNSWPEFTPMYWMEEFLNRINDDDAEIQQWMMRNQYPGAYSGQAAAPPAGAAYSPWMPQPYSVQQFNSWPAAPYQGVPYQGTPSPGTPSPGVNTPPVAPAYIPPPPPPAMGMPGAGRPPAVANLPPSERARQAGRTPARQAPFQTEMPQPSASPYPEFDHLPNLTPEEFSRMPPQLQQQYEYEFNQAFVNYRKRLEFEQTLKRRPPAYAPRPRGDAMPRGYQQR